MTTNGELKFHIDDKTTTASYGRFELEPLERGNGITVGNSLRRILMTSIPGAAIISVRIDGVLHEFSTIDGVVEDVLDIIQNLKQVRFRLKDNRPDKVQLSFTGAGNFTAKDINEASKQFRVMNPALQIATLNNDANFTMELQIGVGKGYVDADAIFNPVTRVTYDVEPVSSAKGSLDRLVIEVHTDGTITPENALNHAANVLIDHFSQFVSEDAEPVLKIVEEIDEDVLRIRDLLDSSIDEMELSVRSHNCLEAAGIERILDLVSKEESVMLKYKNFGRKSLSELVEKLGEVGLSFGMDVKRYMLETDH